MQAYKASGVGNEEIRDGLIEICVDLSGYAPERLDDIYEQEAEEIELELLETLPGGVYDRLCVKMMARCASSLVIPKQVKTAVEDSDEVKS